MAPAQPSGDSLIDGFRTPLVDVNDLKHMADPSFKPDKAALWNTHKSRDGWVLAHNSVRFELGEMKRVLAALANTTLAEWQVAAVKAWWAGHATHVHEHHANEDNIFNPFLRTRITYPDKLEKDHVFLVAAMTAIAEEVKILQTGSTLERLQPLWEHYEKFMHPHLFEEEQVGLPLARAYFTHAEIEKCTAIFLKTGDPVSLGAFVHVLGHKRDAQQFMSENGIPSFVWHIPGGFKALRTIYRVKMQSHIDSLLAGEPVSARTKKLSAENALKATKKYSESVGAQSALSPRKRENVMTRISLVE